MKLLSIDVGMKNLAFCLMDLNDDDNFENKIQKWGVINLCEDEIIPCKELTKSNCVCNKTSTFYKNDKYYCKTHAKKVDSYKVPNTELRLNKLKKYKINKLKDLCSKYEIPLEKKMKKQTFLIK